MARAIPILLGIEPRPRRLQGSPFSGRIPGMLVVGDHEETLLEATKSVGIVVVKPTSGPVVRPGFQVQKARNGQQRTHSKIRKATGPQDQDRASGWPEKGPNSDRIRKPG